MLTDGRFDDEKKPEAKSTVLGLLRCLFCYRVCVGVDIDLCIETAVQYNSPLLLLLSGVHFQIYTPAGTVSGGGHKSPLGLVHTNARRAFRHRGETFNAHFDISI
jgi:hypothetical protein